MATNDPIVLTCAHCGTPNRLPESRLAESPSCGRCHQPVLEPSPLVATDANLDQLLGRNDLPVLIDCWAAWCGPCRQFAPTFERASAQFQTQIRFAKLDTEANRASAARLRIQSIPTLVLFAQGREIARQSGAMSYQQLTQWLAQAFGLDREV